MRWRQKNALIHTLAQFYPLSCPVIKTLLFPFYNEEIKTQRDKISPLCCTAPAGAIGIAAVSVVQPGIVRGLASLAISGSPARRPHGW